MSSLSAKRAVPEPATGELIDSHCHLDMEPYRDAPARILAEASHCGVRQIISIGIDSASSSAAVHLAGQYPGVYATIGFHPHNAEEVDEKSLLQLAKLAQADKVVAYGEIGLDYAKKYAEPKVQQRAFSRQLELAIELNLPVVIHDRDAHADTARLIKAAGHLVKGGVMHCFSGDRAFAEEMIGLGFMLSIPGVVTFKNAAPLHDVVRAVSLEHFILETDGPFLAPVPYRGKANHPAYLIHTAQKVADLKDLSLEEVARQTTANSRRLFNLPTLHTV